MSDNAVSPQTNAGLCMYPSKRCDNPRVLKRNGQLHKFCEFHRQKANFNQRRLEYKRKVEKVADIPDFTPTRPLRDEEFVALRAILPRIQNHEPMRGELEGNLPVDLDDDDIRILVELVSNFDDDSDEVDGAM